MSHHHNNRPPGDCGCNDNGEKDTPTQKAIIRERLTVCTALFDANGELVKQQEKFKKEKELYHEKKCLFVSTEENFRRYRNLDITVGTELVQTNESVKANVTNFNKWNKDLNTALKNIAKGIKDAKTKFNEVQKAANDLENCLNDSCNKAQRKALTGKAPDCPGETKLPPACKDAGRIIDELICVPKGLWTDIDSIFKSAHDVVGIQVFSNVETLEPLQKVLDDQTKLLKTHLTDVVILRETDLKNQKGDLVKSVQDITKAAMDRNNARSMYEGYLDAVDELCCPECGCVTEPKDDGNNDCEKLCEPRLKNCETKICNICKDVKETFCCEPCDGKQASSR